MSRPNILWIVTTQWRAQACGYAGDVNARTPALDRLAATGLNCSQAVTPHPFGPFARAALLTGQSSPGNGVRDYFDPLPAGARTVAHDLAERGYRTAFFGKWHLAQRDPRAALVGEAHARMKVPAESRGGFEMWEGFESGFLLNDPWLHGTRQSEPVQVLGYQSDVLGARAAEWLRETSDVGKIQDPEKSRPNFCVVSLEAPHPPYDAPLPAGIFRRDPRELSLPANVPRGGEIEEKARQELAGYYAHIEATDRAIGRLLELVSSETLIVFTSVHGDMHGAHGLFRKGWPYEESVRVPLLIRAPRGGALAPDANVSTQLLSLVNLRELTLAWADGVNASFFDAKWAGSGQRISMPSVVALPHQCDRIWRGVRTSTRKLILNEDGSPWLFFDLQADPLEERNLVGDKSRVGEVEEMRSGFAN